MVDKLLKQEFDKYRSLGISHPIQKQLDLIPALHPCIEKWKDPLKGGVSYFDYESSVTYYGTIDDLWVDSNQTYYVVEYKSTANINAIKELPEWATTYKRQVEIYQWLLRKKGLNVSDKVFFVYCTAGVNQFEFNNKLCFQTNLISYQANDYWIDQVILDINSCLSEDELPDFNIPCTYCQFSLANKS